MKVFIVGFDQQIESMWKSRKGIHVINDIKKADVVQFIGGPDVHPRLYGELPLQGTYFSEGSDTRDINAWNSSNQDQLKVGICRGGQFLNVMNKGSMWQHVDNHAVRQGHMITDCMFNRHIKVTSTHHQMMIPGPKAEVVAFAEGIAKGHRTDKRDPHPASKYDTEVVWYEDSNTLCFQPHPEYQGVPDCRDYFFDLIEILYDQVA